MSLIDEDENGDRRVGDYNRPRRPNPDTIVYLRSLPLDVKASEEEISQFLATEGQLDPSDYPQSLAAALSAIDEIRNEIASLAGDEYGSQAIEILARIAVPYSEVAAKTLLYGLSTYHLHLATHRYGSHVVQTILELSVSYSYDKDMSLHKEAPQLSQAPDQLPSLSELILGVVEELAPHASQLAVHVCGSHVLRTLLCVLGGVKLVTGPGVNGSRDVSIRRGRVKNKRKKKEKTGVANEPPHAGLINIEYQTETRLLLDSTTEKALSSLTDALCGISSPSDGPGELQQMACHPSASPLIIVLLRILTYSTASDKKTLQQHGDENSSIADYRLGILKPEPTFESDTLAHRLVERLLCWQPTKEKQSYTGDIIYGLSGEPRGSHVLETVMRISPEDVYASILDYGGFTNAATMQEYIEHDVSNFAVQTLLSTVRTKEQAEMIWKTVERTVTSGYVLDSGNKRRGILWRAVEMLAKYRVNQESLLKSIRVGMGMMGRSQEEIDDDTTVAEEGTKKKKKRQKAASLSMQECVPKLLNVKPPEMDGGRVVVDAAGARSLYHLLRFTPRLCGDVLDGIIGSLTSEELVWIAKDGLGSRCIMDGILDGPNKEPTFAKANKNLLKKLSGQWASLGVDRVGNHTVKKLFRALTEWQDKAVLTSELAQSLNKLGGNAMGRSVIEACAVKEFLEGEEVWKTAVRKTQQREEWVQEIFNGGEKTEGKKKRKRKRQGKQGSTNDDDGEEEGLKRKRTEKTSSVDVIVKTISAGVEKSLNQR